MWCLSNFGLHQLCQEGWWKHTFLGSRNLILRAGGAERISNKLPGDANNAAGTACTRSRPDLEQRFSTLAVY